MAISTTYEPIATYTATGSSVYLEATNIPSTYTDLIVVLNIKESGQDGLNIQVGNGSYDTGSNYSNTFVQGNGSSAGSGRALNQTYAEIGIESNEWGNTILHFQNYANTNVYKTILSRTNSTNFLMRAVVATWRSNSAIERIRIYNGSNANHSAGSTMTLYGIAAAPAAGSNKATGGTITVGSGYTYHAFTSGGTFTPSENITADILLIAGGGGGGTYSGGGGGGGAGGVLLLANQSLTSGTGYTVSVGGGGAANTSGQNSYFGALTQAVGGGYGGSASAGGNGGSGGGASDTGYAAGTGTAGQGFNGGTGTGAGSSPGGGGGGAAEAGQNAYGDTTPNIAGKGGSGTNFYYDWAAVTSTGVSGYYAGGGGGGVYINSSFANNGGGAGGNGGGGSGSASNKNATANTGSGGGGGSYTSSPVAPGNGGSGLVIVRYAN